MGIFLTDPTNSDVLVDENGVQLVDNSDEFVVTPHIPQFSPPQQQIWYNLDWQMAR